MGRRDSTKSPIKTKPLRNPGESLEKEIQDELFDKVLTYYLVAMLLVLMAAQEWWRWYTEHPPAPLLYTAIAVVALVVATVKLVRAKRRITDLKLGLSGERAVGQYLERLREHGAQVIHDFPGDGFNIDHVVVHPSGVYSIETKTWSKPSKGDAQLLFDGEKVETKGWSPDRNPVTQARASSRWLRELIEEITGKKVPVRPVVVFPGWYIQPTAQAKTSDIWVLNPKALPAFIDNSKPSFPESDARTIAAALSRYVRNS